MAGNRKKKLWQSISFEEAREFVRNLGLRRQEDWFEYCNIGKKPTNIPTTPNTVYSKDWKGYGDWLRISSVREYKGKQRISSVREYKGKQNSFISFEQAREFARSLNLSGQKAWIEYCRFGQRPKDIPAVPNLTYKEQWKGYGDWLGTGRKNSGNLLSFEEAREFARSLNLSGQKAWIEYCRSGKKPTNIPSTPYIVYSDEWKGVGDWLGTTRTRSVSFRPFEEAREFARSLKLDGQQAWKEYFQTNSKPEDIPYAPDKTYQDQWISWYDWLGKEETVWSAERVKELLRGLIESNVIFQWDQAVLYSFLLRKGILNLNNRHKDFFKNLIVAGHTEEGRKFIEEYVDSDSRQPPDLSQFNSFQSNKDVEDAILEEEEEEIKEATMEDLETLVDKKEEPLDYGKIRTVEQILSNTTVIDSISVDEEAMQFLINYSVNEFWKSAFKNERETINKIMGQAKNGNRYHDTVLDTFISNYNGTKNL